MKTLRVAAVAAALLACTSAAHAGKLLFGTDERIHFVASSTIQTPSGRLYLGHRVRMHAFLLPYHVESKGLVFGISGEPNKYIPLPPQEELASLQSAGLLPKDLPQPELTGMDYLFGYSLELFVLGALGWWGIRRTLARR